MRVALILLAVIAVAVGLAMSWPWLYGVAGALVLGVLVSMLPIFQRTSRSRRGASKETSSSRDDELRSLGIMEIKPKSKSRPATPQRKPEPSAPRRERSSARETAAPPRREAAAAPAVPREAAPAPPPAAPEPVAEPEEDALAATLEATRQALGARAVILAERHGGGYRTLAAAGTDAADTFDLPAALVPPRGGTAFAHTHDDVQPAELTYANDARHATTVAAADVPAADALLLADGDDLDATRAPQMLRSFAATLATLLGDPDDETSPTPAEPPRRVIIAEEMEDARALDASLALALVHLLDAEAVAEEGEDAVEEAERQLAARLRELAPEGRVERFGELTFGVFQHLIAAEAEAWAMDVQHDLADAEPPLGPVAIGIALLDERHDSPDAFRADATGALRTAFETGTPTLVE